MSVTRVPLQPIAKGSLTKLWVGVIIVLLLGAGLAWAGTASVRNMINTTENGVKIITLADGEAGVSPSSGDIAAVSYVGQLLDGTVFDANEQAAFSLAGPNDPPTPPMFPTIIPGLREAMLTMEKGGRYRVIIPSDQAYGDQPKGDIPANSDLQFEIELRDFRSMAELEAEFRAMQQQQQQLPPGVGGPPPGAGGPVQPLPGQ
ncbi:FKBP-type peptidyl-prolyl cis-trans isomerase [Alterisphingorhabdus coralli]|uniref:Peptidyl-prolyl cis-trans isomerase n=1 Tax=Alterisphingorhabdus coralli TaxID=3071408 RepID=A0AA97F9H0_9SPHN|nr:FKBP-type peptidyl-prolyl cis-trans isomerase [Parasphingorhabdus sp. SCSIO 66989]WOE75996.1 FKBP-type peptidyl-prolyl cis-trans isomerase [Parasphingorhabdus sp. SCSIO 66989]